MLLQKIKLGTEIHEKEWRLQLSTFLCLFKCCYTLGSYHSTFGEAAAKYGGVEECII